MVTRVVLTYKDYEALPADGRRYELHEGELSVTPAPTPRHQRTSLKVSTLLENHAAERGLGQVFYVSIDCILSDNTVVQPDIVFIETARLDAISARGIEGPPTLVIEILSPSTTEIDRHVKFQLYARHHVPHYWIVDHDGRTIEAYSLAGDNYELVGRLAETQAISLPPFPDLVLAPASIWP